MQLKTSRPMAHPTQQRSNASLSIVKMCLWLVLALASLPRLAAGNHNRVQYDDASIAYTGRGCLEDWCGEKWRSNRILYYNLTVESKLVFVNKTIVKTINDCQGAQSSLDCEQTHSEEQVVLEKAREDVISRVSDKPIEVRDHETPELKHSFLLSDNVVLNENTGTPQLVSERYPANLTKIWQIKIPKGCKMNVHFFNFSIEKSDNCEHDYFSMQTSKKPEDVLVFCDRLEWIAVRYRKRVQFTLHSDYALNRGQVAAHVCLSQMNTNTGECDCTEESRKRRSVSTTALENNEALERRSEAQQALRNQRLAALRRLRSRSSLN